MKVSLMTRILGTCLLLLLGNWSMLMAQSADTAPFNFENGQLHGFYGGNLAPELANDTGRAYAGSASLKVTCTAPGKYEVQIDSPGQIAAGTPIDFYLYIPAGITASFQPFILDGAWGWSSAWIDKSTVQNNTWIKASVVVPKTAVLPINRLGIQILTDNAGSLWIDSISFVSFLNVDKSKLEQLLITTHSLYDQALEGENLNQYQPGSKVIFGDAIAKAEQTLNKSGVTQSEIDLAVSDLEKALTAFEYAKNTVQPPLHLILSVQAVALQLQWEPAPNGGLYTVKRAVNFAGPYSVLLTGSSALSYTDSQIEAKTTYYYTVTATKDGMESKPSSFVYGKIQAPAQLQDLPLFVNKIPGGWVGGDNDCIETVSSLYPIDNKQIFNNQSSLRINLKKNGTWWCGLLAGPDWCTYNLSDYYANGSLEFNIKGAEGGESFLLGFFDKVPEREPLEKGIEYPITSFVTITKEWQHVSIPLKSLLNPATSELKSITYLRFEKDWGSSQQVFTAWVNDIRVTSPDTEKVYAAIKVNQLGYTQKAEKYALVSCFDGVYPLSETTSFSVKKVEDGKVVYTGKLRKVTELDKDVSGEKIFLADFTKVMAPGTYKLAVDAPGVPDSYAFKIGRDIYQPLLAAAARYFYYQRANMALSPENALNYPREDYTPDDYEAALESDPDGPAFDVSGGWYDAGDFGKYTNAGAMAVSDMLWAYQLFPRQFTDNQFNIPESGNAIPDILDEIKYEIDFLLKMQASDGGFYHRVQGGTIIEDNQRLIMDTRAGQTRLEPTSHTASAAGMLAHAALVFKPFAPDYAKKLLAAAALAWQYLENHPELVPSLTGPYNDDNDKDDRLYAAAALFRATKEKKYNDYFLDHYTEYAEIFDNPANAHSWGSPALTAFLHYASSPSADKTAYSWFKEKFSYWRGVQLSRAYNNPWRNSLHSYDYYWGSNLPVLCTSMDLVIGSKLFGEYNSQVINVVRSNLNYVLGINPIAFSYVSGFGENSMQHTFSGIYNGDGKTGMPDGYLAGGANSYQGSWFSRFSGKCYNDINTEWTTNEHTIYWNSGLVFSAALVNEESREKAGVPTYAVAYPEKPVIGIKQAAPIHLLVLTDDGKAIDLTGATIIYQVEKPELVSIDDNGNVTGVKQGVTKIDITVVYGTQTIKTTTGIIVHDPVCTLKK